MIQIKNVILILLFGVIRVTGNGQPVVPAHFVELVPPEVGTGSWFLLNHYKDEFGVRNEKGLLKVGKVKEKFRGELLLKNGKLVGIDNGEWGGELKFVPFDKRKKSVQVKQGNIKHIFNFKGDTYFFDAINHGTISRGSLYKLRNANDIFTYEEVVTFEDAPEAYAIFGDTILIASYENFYILHKFKKEIIVSKAFWGGLYPNSIAPFDEENIFIGMRSGLVQLNLVTRQYKFFKHQK